MISGEKSKIAPRDTFLVQELKELNGCQYAELYKLGDKITNRPQLVKVQDLMLLPTTRAAKAKAKVAIKDMVPYIKAIVKAMVPTHAWSYSRLLQELQDEELDIEDEIETGISTEGEVQVNTPEGTETKGVREENNGHTWSVVVPRSPQPSPHDVRHPPTPLDRLLSNPSIQLYPQRPELVTLDAVQNVSEVFDSIYAQQQDQSEPAPEVLPSRPRPSYRQFR